MGDTILVNSQIRKKSDLLSLIYSYLLYFTGVYLFVCLFVSKITRKLINISFFFFLKIFFLHNLTGSR